LNTAPLPRLMAAAIPSAPMVKVAIITGPAMKFVGQLAKSPCRGDETLFPNACKNRNLDHALIQRGVSSAGATHKHSQLLHGHSATCQHRPSRPRGILARIIHDVCEFRHPERQRRISSYEII
jgi:hypothetical protein